MSAAVHTLSPDARSGRLLGARIADARRGAGLTQKALADAVGVPLATVGALERGVRRPAPSQLERIADATGKPGWWFRPGAPPASAPDGLSSNGRSAAFDTTENDSKAGRDLVLSATALLIVIRLFTEVLHVLPRAGNFIDGPLVVLLALAASMRPAPNRAGGRSPFLVLGVLFLAAVAVGTIANPSRVEPGPALVFVYGFLAPLAVYWATYRLWPAGQALSLSRLLVVLGVLQFVVVFGFDLPRFLTSLNPDDIAGTFGTNAYQLAFLLLLLTSLLAGIFTFEHERLTARLLPIFLVLIATATFLTQYRALLVTTAIALVVLGIFLVPVGGRGILATALAVGAFAGSLWFVASQFPVTKFDPLLNTLREEPFYLAETRLRSARTVTGLYTDNPRFMATGTGPGTFSSRAWRTFADTNSTSRSDVAGPYVMALTRGASYRTDVSERYVVPRLRSAQAVQGSRAVNSPLSSYLSLLAEVGVLGAVLLVAIYVAALSRAVRMTLRAVRWRTPQDPLPALALASTTAFCVVLQMAALENWLEVTRVTFVTWILFAVLTKEHEARWSE